MLNSYSPRGDRTIKVREMDLNQRSVADCIYPEHKFVYSVGDMFMSNL